MGDLSRYNQAVQGYMRNGLSRQAAERQAGWDMARDLTQTAVQGGVRGIAFSAGGMAYGSGRQRSRGSYDVNDMAARAANGQIAGDSASRVDPSFTDTDLEIAEILQEDAPRKPFTYEVDSGIVEADEKVSNFDSQAKDAHYQNLVAYKNIDPELFRELETSGVKYTAEDVITLFKNHEGKLLWLEKGNQNAGLEHIMKHANDFASQGIHKNQIVDFIKTAIRDGKIVGYQCRGQGRPIYEVDYRGKTYRVAVRRGFYGKQNLLCYQPANFTD